MRASRSPNQGTEFRRVPIQSWMTPPADPLPIDSWRTPATDYPTGRVGNAEIARVPQEPGVHQLHGERGRAYYKTTAPIDVTMLYIDEQPVMWDDPPHWFAIQRCAARMTGNVLVAGLGLGLILHALKENPNVTRVAVVEKEQSVVEAVLMHCPATHVVIGDFWREQGWPVTPDSVFVDLNMGDYDDDRTQRELAELPKRFPTARVVSVNGVVRDVRR